MTDDQLLAALRDAFEHEDPKLLADIVRLGVESFSWNGVDQELTTLLMESSEPAVAMRSTTQGRHFTFSTEEVSVDVGVMQQDDHCVLVGWIDPVVQFDVRVFSTNGEVVATAPVDDRGRFRIELSHRGPVRLEFARQPAIATEWFSTN
jgi:hypothetical protein